MLHPPIFGPGYPRLDHLSELKILRLEAHSLYAIKSARFGREIGLAVVVSSLVTPTGDLQLKAGQVTAPSAYVRHDAHRPLLK